MRLRVSAVEFLRAVGIEVHCAFRASPLATNLLRRILAFLVGEKIYQLIIKLRP